MSQELPSLYQSFIHLSRYSRWLDDKKRRETWSETVARYFDFFEDHLKTECDYDVPSDLRKELETAVLNLEIMPSMRALMTAGEALKRDNVAGYNCSYVSANKPKSFDEILYILMCGTGVGFSVEREFIKTLPTIAEEFQESDTTIVVQDSKMGWAKAYRELFSLLIGGQVPKWDTSKVRPAGARLKTFGGRASGPEPLEDLFRFTVNTFRNAAGRKLTSLECHDIICKIAEIVVVGGVRRSALISLSSLTDERMRDAKSGAWWEADPQRAIANNSVAYREKPEPGIFMEEWLALYKSKSGERGIFNREAAKKQTERSNEYRKQMDETYRIREPEHDFGTNPCCLDGDTLIDTNVGQVPISQIIADPNGFMVLSYNHETDSVEYTEILSGDMTRPNADIIELEILDENNKEITIRLTPDHKVWTENRGYVDAIDLTEEDTVVISENYAYGAGIYSKEISYVNGEDSSNNKEMET